jgi:hypothetical protein
MKPRFSIDGASPMNCADAEVHCFQSVRPDGATQGVACSAAGSWLPCGGR